jgi:hypothetical protein
METEFTKYGNLDFINNVLKPSAVPPSTLCVEVDPSQPIVSARLMVRKMYPQTVGYENRPLEHKHLAAEQWVPHRMIINLVNNVPDYFKKYVRFCDDSKKEKDYIHSKIANANDVFPGNSNAIRDKMPAMYRAMGVPDWAASIMLDDQAALTAGNGLCGKTGPSEDMSTVIDNLQEAADRAKTTISGLRADVAENKNLITRFRDVQNMKDLENLLNSTPDNSLFGKLSGLLKGGEKNLKKISTLQTANRVSQEETSQLANAIDGGVLWANTDIKKTNRLEKLVNLAKNHREGFNSIADAVKPGRSTTDVIHATQQVVTEVENNKANVLALQVALTTIKNTLYNALNPYSDRTSDLPQDTIVLHKVVDLAESVKVFLAETQEASQKAKTQCRADIQMLEDKIKDKTEVNATLNDLNVALSAKSENIETKFTTLTTTVRTAKDSAKTILIDQTTDDDSPLKDFILKIGDQIKAVEYRESTFVTGVAQRLGHTLDNPSFTREKQMEGLLTSLDVLPTMMIRAKDIAETLKIENAEKFQTAPVNVRVADELFQDIKTTVAAKQGNLDNIVNAVNDLFHPDGQGTVVEAGTIVDAISTFKNTSEKNENDLKRLITQVWYFLEHQQILSEQKEDNRSLNEFIQDYGSSIRRLIQSAFDNQNALMNLISETKAITDVNKETMFSLLQGSQQETSRYFNDFGTEVHKVFIAIIGNMSATFLSFLARNEKLNAETLSELRGKIGTIQTEILNFVFTNTPNNDEMDTIGSSSGSSGVVKGKRRRNNPTDQMETSLFAARRLWMDSLPLAA